METLSRGIQSGWRRAMAKGDRCRSIGWGKAWKACYSHRFGTVRRLAGWCERVGQTASLYAETEAEGCKGEVLRRATILLCTIASTSRMMREWEEHVDGPLSVHTAIIDECGCTAEASVGLLLRMQLRNLILVGDHKQLPPTSMVPPSELDGTGHTRSLLERCVLASGAVHRLTEQYRMHQDIADVVSGLFYHSLLETPASVAHERQAMLGGKPALAWVDVGEGHGESNPERSKSLQNLGEAKVVCSVAAALRAEHPDASIAVLTFYKGQLLEIMRTLAASLKVEVLTVDACQGSEFEYVVLSTVRSNSRGKLGFVKDKQRVCVAISRAMRQLVCVGCADTLASDGAWRTVTSRAERQSVRQWETVARNARTVVPTSGGRSVLEELDQSKADARAAAAAAVLSMQQHPSFGAGKQQERGQAASKPGRQQLQQQQQQRGSSSQSKASAYRSAHRVQATPHPSLALDMEADFPTLGGTGSRVPVRASHLARGQVQENMGAAEMLEIPTAAAGGAASGGADCWEVSEIMMVEMFGAGRVATVVSMLGGDLQRAFVSLLESDNYNDQDDEGVDDDEWDYERAGTVSDGTDGGYVAGGVDGWEEAPSWVIDDDDDPEQDQGTQGVMSVAASAFVPSGPAAAAAVGTATLTSQEEAKRNARERALQILRGKTPLDADVQAPTSAATPKQQQVDTWWDGDEDESEDETQTEIKPHEPQQQQQNDQVEVLRIDPSDGLL